VAEKHPSKPKRREYFNAASHMAEFVLETRANARPKGARGTQSLDELSYTASQYYQEAAFSSVQKFHWALPFVVMELVKPDVLDQIQRPKLEQPIIDLPPWPQTEKVRSLDLHVVSIMATGLDRFVRRNYERQLYAGPDFNADEVRHRYFVTHCPVEVSREYREWLQQLQPQSD
jgi:hypothetical protein